MGSNPGYLLKSFLLYQVIFKEHGKFYQILWSSHNIWTLKTHPNPFLPNGLTIFSQTILMQWQKWIMDWITMTSEGSILWNFKLKRSSGLLMHLFNIFMRFCTSLPKKTMKHLKKRKGKIFRAFIFWYFTDDLTKGGFFFQKVRFVFQTSKSQKLNIPKKLSWACWNLNLKLRIPFWKNFFFLRFGDLKKIHRTFWKKATFTLKDS